MRALPDKNERLKRPILRYHGGKWLLSPWIIENFPAHKIYTESFGGGGAVLLRKPRAYVEVYNDLDGDIVNLFRVARDRGAELRERLRLTPFARAEFDTAFDETDCEMERARRTLVRAWMGFGSNSATCKKSYTGFRPNSAGNSIPAHQWKNYADSFSAIIARLSGLVIENRDAQLVMSQHDGPETLHYVDPPYITDTRGDRRADYRFEMTDAEHGDLLGFLRTLKGDVVLSGYRCDLYDSALADWQRLDKATVADGARPRVECLWLSPSIQQRSVPSGGLFPGGGRGLV